MLPEVANALYADKINSSLHGIAKDVDVAKRNIADAILKADDDFAGISFLLPNGDMYIKNLIGVNSISRKIILHLEITLKEQLKQKMFSLEI